MSIRAESHFIEAGFFFFITFFPRTGNPTRYDLLVFVLTNDRTSLKEKNSSCQSPNKPKWLVLCHWHLWAEEEEEGGEEGVMKPCGASKNDVMGLRRPAVPFRFFSLFFLFYFETRLSSELRCLAASTVVFPASLIVLGPPSLFPPVCH